MSARADAGESRELRRQQRPCRAAADDEDVDGVGKARRPLLGAGRWREDVGVAGLVAIQIELHVSSLSFFHQFSMSQRHA